MSPAEELASFFLQLINPSRMKVVMQLLAQKVSKLLTARNQEISQEGSLCVALGFLCFPCTRMLLEKQH